MKLLLIIIACLCFGSAMAQKKDSTTTALNNGYVPNTSDGRTYYSISSQFDRPAGRHLPATDTTIVLNKGKADCPHEWVDKKPMYHSDITNAVYINPESDRSWEIFRICKQCLRHENVKYFSKWVLNKDEYGELVKKINTP